MPKRGEHHHHAKLTAKQVEEIRKLYEHWKANRINKGYGEIQKLYGIGQSTARDIVTYRTW